ncbi:excalibur calcium-binding domain-containing protein [Aliivibrio fischeri]|uniref:excalibur calcium-binding domain-containing protein n=1 Tax=Aliivibrio fischeri TaxID=668 RepID=UPI00084C6496|nr:excalibur calcium-binding domain-containing protein [Aliivibrio fischeri]OED53016.1 hypothetical protein BEI47_18370 [Aliivibrio fischeri]
MKKFNSLLLVITFSLISLSAMAKHYNNDNTHHSNHYDNNSYSDHNDDYQSRDRCNGKHYCSDVKTYAEAKWVLNNCPNTHMDGDNDGVPCERQFHKN